MGSPWCNRRRPGEGLLPLCGSVRCGGSEAWTTARIPASGSAGFSSFKSEVSEIFDVGIIELRKVELCRYRCREFARKSQKSSRISV